MTTAEAEVQDTTAGDAASPEKPTRADLEYDALLSGRKAGNGAEPPAKEEQRGEGEARVSGEEKAATETPAPQPAWKLDQAGEELVRAHGLEPVEVSEKTFKAIQQLNQKAEHAENERKRYGSQNHTLSQYFKKAQGRIRELEGAPELRGKRIEELLKRIPEDRLTDEERKLLKDRDFVGVVAEVAKALRTDDREPEERELPEQHAPAPVQDEAAVRERAVRTAAEIEQAGFKDFASTYASPEFRAWMEKEVTAEIERNRKIFGEKATDGELSPTFVAWTSPAADGHLYILRRYSEHQARKTAEKQEADRKRERADAFDTHGDTTSTRTVTGGKRLKDMTEDEIQGLSLEEFQRLSRLR